MSLESKLNAINDMIMVTITNQDLNCENLFRELDVLKDEIKKNYIDSPFMDVNDNAESVGKLEEEAAELRKIAAENKIKLRLYRESLSLLLMETNK
ncbi:hypothetical protein SteCoe_5244 [Stentor coeruleus]|uniref:Uncharacterized protein n=1 Tax=Stentor coeruleus TaxID=5963 RepID=A0A1R2CSQ8_9CILI|nr:hypothetical protein SteCoe_5244 [Stentor coeruleus]